MKKHSYTNELKIRFKTSDGVELLKQFKAFVRKEGDGTINQIAEDLMIPQMRNYIGAKLGINEMLSEHVSDSMDKLSKTLSKTMKKSIDQVSYEIQNNTLPMDLKLTLLMNLLADKDVIDAMKIDSPEPSDIQEGLVFTNLKKNLASEHLNKEKKD